LECSCKSGEWERYLQQGVRHGFAKPTTLLRCVDGEKDLQDDLPVAMWRVGGKHNRERFWYNTVLVGCYTLRVPDGGERQVAVGN